MRVLCALAVSVFLTAPAVAADIEILQSEDTAVCDYFKTTRPPAPITWQRLADSSDGYNYHAVFDFENTGTQMQVRRRDDQMLAFAGTYFLVAPQGADVSLDWFRDQAGGANGFKGPPAPMKMYWHEEMNSDAEIVQFNKRYYVRATPIYDDFPFIMILEAKDGKLKQICRYKRPD